MTPPGITRKITILCVLEFALTGTLSARLVAPGQAQGQDQSSGKAQTQDQSQSRSQAQPSGAGDDQAKPGSSATVAPPSLGELAREQRADRAKASNPPPRIFTNDTLPKASGGLSIIGPPPGEEHPSAGKEGDGITAGRIRARISDLKEQLETHQRELGVLQQKLGENNVQYYPNPNDILHQEYSRQDINRLTEAIEQKKRQIETDQQAIAEAEDELSRRGLQLTAPEAGKEAAPAKADLSGVTKGSEEYWRLRFKAAREALSKAQEQEKLAEDEIALLESQQAHEIASGGASAFEAQISGKRSEVESKRAAVEQAQRDLDALTQEFKESGSPQRGANRNNAAPSCKPRGASVSSPDTSNRPADNRCSPARAQKLTPAHFLACHS